MNNSSKIVQGPPRPRPPVAAFGAAPSDQYGDSDGPYNQGVGVTPHDTDFSPHPPANNQPSSQVPQYDLQAGHSTYQFHHRPSFSLPTPVDAGGGPYVHPISATPHAYYTIPPPHPSSYSYPPPMNPPPPPAPIIGSLAKEPAIIPSLSFSSHPVRMITDYNTMPLDNQSNMIPIMTRQSQYEYPTPAQSQVRQGPKHSLLDEMIVPKDSSRTHSKLSEPGSSTPGRSRDPRLKAATPLPSISSTRETDVELEEPPPPQVSRLQATVPLLRRAVDKMVREEKGLLGLRRDLYEPGGSSPAPEGASYSYHQPVDTPHIHLPEPLPDFLNIQEEMPSSTMMLEEKYSDTDTVSSHSKMPDSTVTDPMDVQDMDTKKSPKLEGKVLDGQPDSVRCNFCPSPGLVSLDMKMVHQATHITSCFSCAACSGRRKFEEFDELVRHIHTLHGVTDSEMVLETIILPEVEGGLRMYKCGVTNCGKTFTAQSEIMLRSHMEHKHGAYYIKVGKGKYILRFCRICGEERTFPSEKDLDSHIEVSHPPEQFGQHLDSDSEDENTTVVKQDPDGEDLTNNLLANLNRPRSGLVEPSSSSKSNEENIATASITTEKGVSTPVGLRQLSVEDGEIESSPNKSLGRSRSPSVFGNESISKRKKTSKYRSSNSESNSSSNHSPEIKKKKKKAKKSGKVKKSKLSKQEKIFKEKIGSFTPEELKSYIKDMKDKKKILRDKNLKKKHSRRSPSPSPRLFSLPEPKVPFPASMNDKPSHFYCMICTKYTGRLQDWVDHRATKEHVELHNTTRARALKKFNCDDIDVQECVVGERRFVSMPEGQCRECLEIFWGKNDIQSHMRDGRCVKKLELQKKEEQSLQKQSITTPTGRRKERSESPSPLKPSDWNKKSTGTTRPKEVTPLLSRSPSPNIHWKPLPKQSDQVLSKWKPLGGSIKKTVFDKSPSPDLLTSPLVVTKKEPLSKINFPKFMLDGKTAYYICKLCKNPVGNVLAWLEHKKSKEHQAAFSKAGLTEKMDEVIIAGSVSVLHRFGDACNKCLVCKVNFPTNAQLYCHEQLETHKVAQKRVEETDREEIRKYGGRITTIFYCELCMVAVCELPSQHQESLHHVRRIKETTQCLHCPKRLDPSSVILHEDAFHPDTGFQCKKCPHKFSSGESLLIHASQHLKRRIESIEELLNLDMFTLPEDLRRMKCRSCRDGVFLGQDSTEVINHVLAFHPQVKLRDMNSAMEFSCQLCLQFFPDEKELTEHIFNKHTNRLSASTKNVPPIKRFVKMEDEVSTKTNVIKREFKEAKEPVHHHPNDIDVRKPQPAYRDRDVRVKNEFRRSPPRSYRARSPKIIMSRSPRRPFLSRSPARKFNSRSPARHNSRSRLRRFISKSPPVRYKSKSPRSPRRSYSSKYNKSGSRSPGHKRNSSRSPSGRKSRSGTGRKSPPRSTWSNQPSSPVRQSSNTRRQSRHSEGRKSQDASPKRNVKRRNSASISRSKSRSRDSLPPSKKVKGMEAINAKISHQLDRTYEEAKLLNNLKKNLKIKKSDMEIDLRAKLENKKVKMLDSRPEGVKMEKVAGEQATRVCPFCLHKLSSDDDLLHHIKLAHQVDMFRCIKCANSLQPTIGWSIEVLLQHLALQHKLNVSISEAIFNYVAFPQSLHRINCKLCPPPYILGTEGFWLGTDLQQSMESVEMHFEQVHIITDKSQVVSSLELACRGCDVTFPHSGRLEWGQHVKKDHESLNRPNRSSGPRKRCDYCGEKVVQTENIRHIKEAHKLETFQCKACLEVDPTCFPYSDTIKEMMQHMVMKHGDQFSSYYDHMVYPVTMYGSLCSGKECSVKGKVIAFDAATIGKHLRVHQDAGGDEVGEFYCRGCDRVKEKFKTIEDVKEHIAKRHKTIIKWKEANGNT